MKRHSIELGSVPRTAAALTAAGAAFLGGVGLRSANAMPAEIMANTPELLARSPFSPDQVAPKDAHIIQEPNKIMLENLKAYIKLKHRWNGVVVLHAPKTDALVSFMPSPSAYGRTFETGTGFIYHTDTHAEEVDFPGIEVFNGRTYLAVGPTVSATAAPEHSTEWGWADLKWLMQNKAVDFYEFIDSKPKPLGYNPAQAATRGVPQMRSWDAHPPTRLDMYQRPDLNGRLHRLKPSKVIPYASK